jgi:glyoxylate carboligase
VVEAVASFLEVFKVELSGAEIVVQALKDEGVEFVWGYPGGAVLHIYDALFNQDTVRHILVRHEQAAPRMPRTAMHARPVTSASYWSPRALELPMP